MRLKGIILLSVLGAGVGLWAAVLADRPRPDAGPRPNAALVQRGAYLVNEVARCGDCHTPRDRRGRLDLTRHLQGAEMWFTSKVQDEEWEDHAPDITRSGKAGKWSEARMVRLLTTGKESDPPMPAYHLTEDDARAMFAYLSSLPGKGAGDARQRGEDRRKRREKGRDRDDD
jgi:mono/diheme cytochrome c family protein